MSDPQPVKADTITLEVRITGSANNPKLKLKVAKPDQDDVTEGGLDSQPVQPGRNLTIIAIPDPKDAERFDRLFGCHACGDPDNLTTWTTGMTAQGTLVRGAGDRLGYFTVIARLKDGKFASADPPIIVRPIITPTIIGTTDPGG